jgi:DNA-binding CsgD family transcriptional regulator
MGMANQGIAKQGIAKQRPQVNLEPGRFPPDDAVERDLLHARALVESAMFSHRRQSAVGSMAEVSRDEAAIHAVVARMLAVARDELVWIVPMRRLQADRGTVPRLRQLADNGLTVRLLCAEDNLLCEDGMRFLDTVQRHGVQLRVADAPLDELMLVDDRMALVRWDVGGPGEEAMAAQGRAILRTLHSFFEWLWDSAVPAAEYRRVGERARDDLTRQILVLLNAGHKDDAAARQLGLSVRTYRRHVAEIMRDLGAASRFQAGARAAKLGLPSPHVVPLPR